MKITVQKVMIGMWLGMLFTAYLVLSSAGLLNAHQEEAIIHV
jgi:hypothetical protein